MFNGEIGTICEDATENEFQASLGYQPYFVDDVSGKPLDAALVSQARLDEKQGVYKHRLLIKFQLVSVLNKQGLHPSALNG